MDVQVPESERRWLHAVLVLGTLVLALILVSQVSVLLAFFIDILLVLLLGWLLAFILSPVVGLVQRAFPRLPRAAAVGLIYVALLVVIGWALIAVAGSLASSIGNFIAELPSFQARLPEIVAPLQGTLDSLGLRIDVLTIAQDLLRNLGDLGDSLVQPLTDLAIFSLGIVGNLFIVIFLSLFILFDQDRILAYINRLVPPRYSETARVFETSVSTSFGGFIRGSVIQGLIMAGITAAAHLAFGLDFMPASAALSGVLQAIPFFGPFFSWIPAVLVAVLTKPDAVVPTLVVMGIGWFVVSNIITPRVMAHAVGIHPILVLVSVLVGGKIAGIAGAIFAVPFAAIIASFFQHFLSRNANVPRDVTSRAAKRVGEREGRRVRVPTPPAVGVGAAAVATEPSSHSPDAAPKPVEPTA
ncbi:MAG: AI-2E family transporter [Chloroflexota bacterium]